MQDVPHISAIANLVHATLPERSAVFADKIKLAPQTCFVLQADGATVGYALAHPWTLHRIPLLDSFLGELPPHADSLYVHDVVVLPEYRGKRAVASLIEIISAWARARGIRFLALVSVYHTQAMWKRFKFCAADGNVALAAKLQSYGDTARYMIRDLEA
jgi:ribosomal protein S18 acetylase RimI-like enzyme